jgi:VanZ family protein
LRRRGRSSDSGAPLSATFPARGPVVSAEKQLPLQRRDRPGFAPGSLTACRWQRPYHGRMPVPVKRPRRPSRPGLLVGIASDASGALSVWLPVLAWAAVIFTFSSIPSLSTGLGGWDTLLRKGAHVTEYAILGALLLRALRRETPALTAGIAYAATDELHQHFVRGRHASFLDLLVDAAGVALGILVLRRLSRPVPGDRPPDMAPPDISLHRDGRGEADTAPRDSSWGQSPGQGR